jgi:hypothetical protein
LIERYMIDAGREFFCAGGSHSLNNDPSVFGSAVTFFNTSAINC